MALPINKVANQRMMANRPKEPTPPERPAVMETAHDRHMRLSLAVIRRLIRLRKDNTRQGLFCITRDEVGYMAALLDHMEESR